MQLRVRLATAASTSITTAANLYHLTCMNTHPCFLGPDSFANLQGESDPPYKQHYLFLHDTVYILIHISYTL